MSVALHGLITGVEEIRALRSHYPVRAGHLASGFTATAAKAHGRACTVLLSSHFERYIHRINEEAVDWLNGTPRPLSMLPEELLLLHSQEPVDELSRTNWQKRADQLRAFASKDGLLWAPNGATGRLEHERLLVWMKSPKPQEVRRFYRQYGIPDIFSIVTRSKHTRASLWLTLKELVEKRNNIAHGDMQTESLPSDITGYITAVVKFATSADGALARRLRIACGEKATPW